ncbi:hypothetical protein DFH09DRAFT_504716 [Mycena vulgaris]|nr:hypothetical protein DFH09DRAFT_504716 [Mycena vulgaris]
MLSIAALTRSAGGTSTARPVAAGAFTLTGCARAALRYACTYAYTDTEVYHGERDYDYEDGDGDGDGDEDGDTSSCASVPSISRTASPAEGERAAIPPGWGARARSKRERARSDSELPRPRIHPVLDALERGSRVGTGRMACAACNKGGATFPRCVRCAQVWCSRECRTSPVHRCAPRRAQTG